MKIDNIHNIYPINPLKRVVKPAFTSHEDKFTFQNIESIEKTPLGTMTAINFHAPQSPAETFKNLKNAIKNNDWLESLFLMRIRTKDDISEISNNLNNIKDIENIKLKKLAKIGIFALGFETDKGEMFKVTNMDHFRGRKHASFDLPLIKSGHFNSTHYYLEEMVSNNDISQNELKEFVKYIESLGYTLRDYLEDINGLIRKDQFGRAINGKLYLIDPECAIKNTDTSGIYKIFQKLFKRII